MAFYITDSSDLKNQKFLANFAQEQAENIKPSHKVSLGANCYIVAIDDSPKTIFAVLHSEEEVNRWFEDGGLFYTSTTGKKRTLYLVAKDKLLELRPELKEKEYFEAISA